MDPLSIATGAASLAVSAKEISVWLYNLVNEVRNIDNRVVTLSKEVALVATLLTAVEKTVRECQLQALTLAHLDQDMWHQIDHTLADCKVALESLERLLLRINREYNPDAKSLMKFLKKPGIYLRFNLHGEEVSDLTNRIYKSNCGMQTALAVINVSLTFRTNVSQENLFHELNHLKSLVQQTLIVSHKPESSADPFSSRQSQNLRRLAQAAQRFHGAASSTASTQIGGENRLSQYGSSWGGSEFGGLTDDKRSRIERWNELTAVEEAGEYSTTEMSFSNDNSTTITSPDLEERSHYSGKGKSATALATGSIGDNDGYDDESDVELDVLRNLTELASASFFAEDYGKAEECLRMAIERSPNVEKSETSLLKKRLVLCYCLQEKWDQAVDIVADLPKTKEATDLPTFQLLQAISLGYLEKNSLDDAYRFCKTVLQGKKKICGKTSPEYYQSLSIFAGICEKKGRVLEAEAVRHSIPKDWSPANILSARQYVVNHTKVINAVFKRPVSLPALLQVSDNTSYHSLPSDKSIEAAAKRTADETVAYSQHEPTGNQQNVESVGARDIVRLIDLPRDTLSEDGFLERQIFGTLEARISQKPEEMVPPRLRTEQFHGKEPGFSAHKFDPVSRDNTAGANEEAHVRPPMPIRERPRWPWRRNVQTVSGLSTNTGDHNPCQSSVSDTPRPTDVVESTNYASRPKSAIDIGHLPAKVHHRNVSEPIGILEPKFLSPSPASGGAGQEHEDAVAPRQRAPTSSLPPLGDVRTFLDTVHNNTEHPGPLRVLHDNRGIRWVTPAQDISPASRSSVVWIVEKIGNLHQSAPFNTAEPQLILPFQKPEPGSSGVAVAYFERASDSNVVRLDTPSIAAMSSNQEQVELMELREYHKVKKAKGQGTLGIQFKDLLKNITIFGRRGSKWAHSATFFTMPLSNFINWEALYKEMDKKSIRPIDTEEGKAEVSLIERQIGMQLGLNSASVIVVQAVVLALPDVLVRFWWKELLHNSIGNPLFQNARLVPHSLAILQYFAYTSPFLTNFREDSHCTGNYIVVVLHCDNIIVECVPYLLRKSSSGEEAEVMHCDSSFLSETCGWKHAEKQFAKVVHGKVQKLRKGNKKDLDPLTDRVFEYYCDQFERQILPGFEDDGRDWTIQFYYEEQEPDSKVTLHFTNEMLRSCFEPSTEKIKGMLEATISELQASKNTVYHVLLAGLYAKSKFLLRRLRAVVDEAFKENHGMKIDLVHTEEEECSILGPLGALQLAMSA